MSPRTRRQELRRARGHNSKPYEINDKTDSVRKQKKPSSSESQQPSRKAKSKASSHPDPPPDLGMPSRAQYKSIEKEYIRSLHCRKQEKALLNQELFDKIWDVLHDPTSARVGTPQFRWWVRKMFVLSYNRSSLSPRETEGYDGLSVESTPVVLHENRPVALKDQIYDVLCYCHDLASHGGRDKTTAVIRDHYSWIPKELIAQFVKACPTCVYKKTGSIDLALTMNVQEEEEEHLSADSDNRSLFPDRELPPLETLGQCVVARCVPLPVSNLIGREVASPEDDLTRFWPTTSGPVHSPMPIHPMPALKPWMNADSYDTQDTCYSRSSEGSSTLVPDLPSGPGFSKSFQELPPMRKLLSADSAYEHVGLHAQGRGITLPPLMKVLSDSDARMSDSFLRPHLDFPDGFGGSPPPPDSSYHGWLLPHNRNGAETTGNGFDDAPQIDPMLLEQEDALEAQDYFQKVNREHSESELIPLMFASPARSQAAFGSIDTVLVGSSSLRNMAFTLGASATSATACEDYDSLDLTLQGHPRFVFPTSLERQDLDNNCGSSTLDE